MKGFDEQQFPNFRRRDDYTFLNSFFFLKELWAPGFQRSPLLPLGLDNWSIKF